MERYKFNTICEGRARAITADQANALVQEAKKAISDLDVIYPDAGRHDTVSIEPEILNALISLTAYISRKREVSPV